MDTLAKHLGNKTSYAGLSSKHAFCEEWKNGMRGTEDRWIPQNKQGSNTIDPHTGM